MVNRSLHVIDLHQNGIHEEGGRAIGDALMVNRSLQVLDLCGNPISAGVVKITESLKHNYSLLEINLSWCGISEKEAESLAISLKENNSLQTLNLRWNNLSDIGAAHTADGLRQKNSLRYFWLWIWWTWHEVIRKSAWGEQVTGGVGFKWEPCSNRCWTAGPGREF